MADIHISDFYKDVASILVRLYNSFPRKTILYVEDIAGADEPDEFGLHCERFLAGFSTMIWLADHGYLQYDAPIRQEALDQAVLTERAFLMLSSRSPLTTPVVDTATLEDDSTAPTSNELPPSLLEHSQGAITQLRQALRSGSSIRIQQCVHQMLSESHFKKH